MLDAELGVDAPGPAEESADAHEILERETRAGFALVDARARDVGRPRQRVTEIDIRRLLARDEEPEQRICRKRAEQLLRAVALVVRRAAAEIEREDSLRVKHVPLVIEREAAARLDVAAPENRHAPREE